MSTTTVAAQTYLFCITRANGAEDERSGHIGGSASARPDLLHHSA
jgi:hypothetical protein